MFVANHLTGFGAGAGAGAFSPLGAQFDGSNDYMRYTGTWTGAADGKLCVISFWINTNTGTDGTRMDIITGNDGSGNLSPFVQRPVTTDRAYVKFLDAGGTTETQVYETANDALTAAAGWQHVLISCDAAGAQQIYINDVDAWDSSGADTDANLEFTPAGDITIGAFYTAANKVVSLRISLVLLS